MPWTRKPKPTDVPETILDQFAGPARPISQAEVDAITRRFKKALVERMLGGELTHHLGYPWKAANDWNLAMNQFAILYEDRFTVPRTWHAPAHGRCRHCGRQERAHSDLENRTARGFPQRPHARSSTRPTHKKPDTPH